MNILPTKTFTLKTTAPLVQVKQQLAKYVEELKLVRWNFSYNHAPYQGSISDKGFVIRRIIHYRNSFLSNIQGRFELLPVGTAVHITMQLHPFKLAFMTVWLGIWYSAVVPMTLLRKSSLCNHPSVNSVGLDLTHLQEEGLWNSLITNPCPKA